MCHPESGFDERQVMQPLPRLASAADNMLSDRKPFRGTCSRCVEAKWAGRLKAFELWARHSVGRTCCRPCHQLAKHGGAKSHWTIFLLNFCFSLIANIILQISHVQSDASTYALGEPVFSRLEFRVQW